MVSNHKPVLIVIAGPNGSGKTTVTEQILRHEWMEDAIYINPDIVAQEKFGDWNSADAVRKSIAYCEELREQCLRERKSLIFETVLSRRDKVDYIRRAKEAGFFVRIFFVCTESPTINAMRIAKRVMQGGHDVPITKIISRYKLSVGSQAGPQSVTLELKRNGGIVRQEVKFSCLNDLISLKYKVTYGQFHSFYS